MKTTPLFLFGALAVGAPAFALESVLPAAHPASRYDTMLERSPFALATPVVAPPPPVASEFSQWYIGGLGRSEDKDFVSIKSRDLSTNFTLYGNEPNADGVQLVGVEWSNERGKSTVTIKKGSEFGKLEFNQAEIAAPTAAPQPGARPGMPQRPGGPAPVGNAPVTNMPVTGTSIQPRGDGEMGSRIITRDNGHQDCQDKHGPSEMAAGPDDRDDGSCDGIRSDWFLK